MTVMATIEEKHTLTALDRRKYFHEKLLQRIREQSGTYNNDQGIREQILLEICSKITGVYVGCLDTVERSLGREVWGHRTKPRHMANMSQENQARCKALALIWEDCVDSIKILGNNIIDDVIYILSRVEFTEKEGIDIIAQAKQRELLKEQRLLESEKRKQERKMNYERNRNECTGQ
jgi:hypothetical protein